MTWIIIFLIDDMDYYITTMKITINESSPARPGPLAHFSSPKFSQHQPSSSSPKSLLTQKNSHGGCHLSAQCAHPYFKSTAFFSQPCGSLPSVTAGNFISACFSLFNVVSYAIYRIEFTVSHMGQIYINNKINPKSGFILQYVNFM